MPEEKSYNSPTTPGLKITFRNYIIELVCLNVNAKLVPRFWNDNKYWGPKYKRELKGIYNLKIRFDDINFDNPILQGCIIEIIQQHYIKSLSAIKTINKVEKLIRKQYQLKIEEIKRRTDSPQETVVRDNNFFIDVGKKTIFSKIRDINKNVETKTT